MTENWICSYCNAHQPVVYGRHSKTTTTIEVGQSKYGYYHYFRIDSLCCSNNDCGEITLTGHLIANQNHNRHSSYSRAQDVTIYENQLLPQSNAKPQPTFIPQPITEDYYEAAAILNLSPKASATLTRRCLQGMIRDFCGISKKTLFQEIEELKNLDKAGNLPKGVTTETIEAIDHVRAIGNIGAHMEKDINHIVSIDPDEAEALINLVEILFEEWYVARDTRTKKLSKLKSISQAKAKQKAVAKPKPSP